MDDLALVDRQLGRRPRAFRRVAVRCPYGRPAVTEQLPFEELKDSPDHEGYLWGNPAFAVGTLLGEAFSQSGWRLSPVGEVGGELWLGRPP